MGLINRQTLSDQIYNILKMEILTREIPFGSKLVNRSLQTRFKVSSSPIRDAINRLNQDGLITSIDTSGATVVDFDYDFFREINEILLYIVNTGIKLSSEKAEILEVVNRLERYVNLQEENMGTDKFYDYDYEFHKTFIDYSNNSRLKKLFKEYNVLHEMLVRSFYEIGTLNIQANSIKTHKQIIQSYKAGDYVQSMLLTEKHYKVAEDMFKRIILKEGRILHE